VDPQDTLFMQRTDDWLQFNSPSYTCLIKLRGGS